MAENPLSFEFPAHANRDLFTDHYLDRVLPGSAEWARLKGEARPVRERIAEVFASFTPSHSEAQTEEDLVRPALRSLGHDYEVQPPLKVGPVTQKPDYVFYRGAEGIAAHKDHTLTRTVAKEGAFAVGDAKHWDRPLDSAVQGSDAFTNKSPSWQIWTYIDYSGVDWGILTNGRKWRLYHKDTARDLDRFYEVDLKDLTDSQDDGRFLYFYAFFRRQAFDDAPLGVAQMLRESLHHARRISDSLREQVFAALRHLAQGFVDYTPNGLRPDATTLKEIHDGSLILLYRLIFVLYAEARGLLPVREPGAYRDTYSLQAIKKSVATDLQMGTQLERDSARIWPALSDLCRYINEGRPNLGIATFNGGLFDPDRYPFLDRCVVGDRHLQQAVDLLARVDRQFVDYRDLSVRHMGTIYEGLLEFRLQAIAPESGWTIDLVNDRGERHATGSYYTPAHVVEYIVDQTVGSALTEAIAGRKSDREKIAATLSVNVLDPAMGSGHFLVEATQYIARFLVDLGVAAEGDVNGEGDLAYWKRRVVQSCIYGVDRNPLAVELTKLSLWLITVARDRPLSFLDHHLRPGDSLAGASLATVQSHLPAATGVRRHRQREETKATGQGSFESIPGFTQSMFVAVRTMELIEASHAETVADVKQQEKWYDEMRQALMLRYGRLANLLTAVDLGLDVDPSHWKELVRYTTNGNGSIFPPFEEILVRADRMAKEQLFFHWELEFPEVYFDEFGRHQGEAAGFEAVVGNPPYVRQEQLARHKPYFETAFPDVYHGVADLYTYFFAQGLRQLRQGHHLGYISSGMFRTLESGAPLRRHINTQATLDEIVDYGTAQVFGDATNYPIIVLITKAPPTGSHVRLRFARNSGTNMTEPAQYPRPLGGAIWVFANSGLEHIIEGWKHSVPLADRLAGPIYRGVTTGLNEAFVVDQAIRDAITGACPAATAILKPFVRGKDLARWSQHTSGLWLITFCAGWTSAALGEGLTEGDAWDALSTLYAPIAEHLRPFSAAARARDDKGQYWWELRPCTYYQAFETPRIHSTKVSLYPTFSLAEAVAYPGNTSYVLPIAGMDDGYFLLGVLNSDVSEYYCRKVSAPKANGYYEVQPGGLSRFPIPEAPQADRAAIGALAMAISEKARERYHLHERAHHRVVADLASHGRHLNRKLTRWWELEFHEFRAEVERALKGEIPVRQRDDWQAWLREQRTAHEALTRAIIDHEVELNARVNALFDLAREDIARIKEGTRHRYGEV